MEHTYSSNPSSFHVSVIAKRPRCYGETNNETSSTESFDNSRILGGENLHDKFVSEKNTHLKLDQEKSSDGKVQSPSDRNITCKMSRRNPKMKRVGYGMYYVKGVVLETKEEMMERFENRREDLLAKLDRMLNDEPEEDVEDEVEEEGEEKEVEGVGNDVEEVIVNISSIGDEPVNETNGGSEKSELSDPSAEEARVLSKDVTEVLSAKPTKPQKKSLFKLSSCIKKSNKSVPEATLFEGPTQRYDIKSDSGGQICSLLDTSSSSFYVDSEKFQNKWPDSESRMGRTPILQLEGGIGAKPRARFNIDVKTDSNEIKKEVPNNSGDGSKSKGKNKNKKSSTWSTMSRLLWSK